MEPRSYLGDLEASLLMAILALGNDAYGVPVRKRVEEKMGRDLSIGSLYTTLDRMEQKGFVISEERGATDQRGGRAKRYFKVEALGEAALNNYLNMVRAQMLEGQRLGLLKSQHLGLLKGGLA